MGRGYRLQNFIFCFLKNDRREGEISKKSYAIPVARVEKLVLSDVSRPNRKLVNIFGRHGARPQHMCVCVSVCA